MTTITEDYVSFETAKLLKEKGFEGYSIITIYDENAANAYIKELEEKHLPYSSDDPKLKEFYYIQPTLQMAMKWLREVHNINISVVPHSYKENKTFDYEFVYWNGEEYHIPYDEKCPTYHELFGKTWKKYEEACEAAIKYCLKYLI